jgi:hypothetical protein
MTKKLQVFTSIVGTYTVGWERDDLPLIHMFFEGVAPGEPFRPSDDAGGPHWPCMVCDTHGFTEQDFHDQIRDALERGPA